MKEVKYKEIKWDERTDKGYEVFVSPTGITYYFLDGRKHRKDGPAVIHPDGSEFWYLNGKRHREDGPAVTAAGGAKVWWLNGKRHREDGPAIIYSDGRKQWFLNGSYLIEKDFTLEMILKMNASELFTPQELAKMRFDNNL